jgi:hypothetical protein
MRWQPQSLAAWRSISLSAKHKARGLPGTMQVYAAWYQTGSDHPIPPSRS